jgi:hypothetical protein
MRLDSVCDMCKQKWCVLYELGTREREANDVACGAVVLLEFGVDFDVAGRRHGGRRWCRVALLRCCGPLLLADRHARE